ncbi:MAG: hypothetical protein IPN76_12930 [Saprospiraceae bacterium]|nr:hypothetical protein [Saprospiraceae bacterium]
MEGELWRTGTASKTPIIKSKPEVKADRDEKRLYLWVNGPDRDSRRNFFNFIRKTLHDIHDSFEKLTVTELVPVPGHDDIFIEYAELVGYEEMGLTDYPVGKLRRKFPVGDMPVVLKRWSVASLAAMRLSEGVRQLPHKDAEYKDELSLPLPPSPACRRKSSFGRMAASRRVWSGARRFLKTAEAESYLLGK